MTAGESHLTETMTVEIDAAPGWKRLYDEHRAAMFRVAASNPSSVNWAFALESLPPRSTHTSPGPFTRISETLASSRNGTIGFKNARRDSEYIDAMGTPGSAARTLHAEP